MTDVPDHFRVLGVRRDANAAQVRAAYVRLIKAHHPDSGHGVEPIPENVQSLRQAYACLKDPDRRQAHDLILVAREQEHDRQVRRLRRKLRSLEQRQQTSDVVHAKRPLDHWRPALAVAAGGTLMLVVAGLLLG